MTKLSTLLFIFLIPIVKTISADNSARTIWPIDGRIDIYHGFGEYRPNRYHAGLDFRTGGRTGKKVVSPVSGYLYRIKMSYLGYGKGLYIMGDDGLIYVFGHLKDFAQPLDSLVKGIQLAEHRYYLDRYFPKDSLRIQAGQFVALSGQTGAGAPHLHFEIRSSENTPVNPLRAGFELADTVPPVLERIGFQYVDNRSLFTNGDRRLYLPVKADSTGKSCISDTILYFSRPFGMLADGYDQIRTGGIKQSPYRLSLSIDDDDWYQVVFDTLDFDKGRTSNLTYDYQEVAGDHPRSRRLFHWPGNNYSGARAIHTDGGIIDFDSLTKSISRHQAVILAWDANGNQARVEVDFFWGPANVYTTDSMVEIGDTERVYYFTPAPGWGAMEIDSIGLAMNRGALWGLVPDQALDWSSDGRIKLDLVGPAINRLTLRLVLFTRYGPLMDQQVVDLPALALKRPAIDYTIAEDGVVVRVTSDDIQGGVAYLKTYRDEQLLAALEEAVHNSMQDRIYFIPATKDFVRIDVMEVSRQPQDTEISAFKKLVNIHLVGDEEPETNNLDGLFSVTTYQSGFWSPSFVALEKETVTNRITFQVNSDLYRILPEVFATRGDFEVSIKLDSTANLPDKTGICWLDEKENKWVWLKDSRLEDGVLRASSMGGGRFAAVTDSRSPIVEGISIQRGQEIISSQPRISFTAVDSLSGIEDDRNISITIDDQWLIPEYDPETTECVTSPQLPLIDGEHMLVVEVTDRVGNLSRQRVPFTVKARNRKKP